MWHKIERLEVFSNFFSKWLNWAACVGLLCMFGLSLADVVGIKFFNWPIPGVIEIVGFLGVVVTAFAIAHTQILGGHIQIQFIVMRFPKQWRAYITAFTSLLGLALFTLLAWRSYDFGRAIQVSGEVSMAEGIPYYPFIYAVSFCCLPVCLVLLLEFLKSVKGMVNK